MKKQLISTSGSLLRFHGPPVTPTKQHKHQHQQNQQQQQQQRDASSSSVAVVGSEQQMQQRHTPPPPIPLSPRLKLHVRNSSTLVHMLVSPTLSTRSSISSVSSNSSNGSAYGGSPRSATSSNSSIYSPTTSPHSPKVSSPSAPSRMSSHSRTFSLPTSPMLSRRSWSNRLSVSFQNLSSSVSSSVASRRSYNPASSPLFEVLDIPKANDYAAFEAWEKNLRLYLGSQELEGVIDLAPVARKSDFNDAQSLKAKKAIQTHVCDKLKMDIQRFDTPAEIFAFLRKTCLPLEGQALGETMVKLATAKLNFENAKVVAAAAATPVQQPSPMTTPETKGDVESVKQFNKIFKGRVWALSQAGSPLPEHAAASMYLGAVEKAFEAWRMSMLWMDLSLGVIKLESLMTTFEDSKNISAWKKKGTAAGLLCWAENMGKDASFSGSTLSTPNTIPETTATGLGLSY
ncbi:hypothetical protein MKZ38_002981 [Zalerion maritima]|uniref:Uncharacterized protein n=1 Tax=Zalerion maritima TaxID=339359 RepID=A0AAD5RPJ9_9PEZI|nr:hypothetical protein MKZ38_002981 [Zalerion maritima]